MVTFVERFVLFHCVEVDKQKRIFSFSLLIASDLNNPCRSVNLNEVLICITINLIIYLIYS